MSDSESLEQRVARRLNELAQSIYPTTQGRPWSHGEISYATGLPVDDLLRLLEGSPVEVEEPVFTTLFQQRLNFLFATRPKSDPGCFSDSEVARAVNYTRQHIGKLRAGQSKPSLPAATALADFFGVQISFFTDAPIAAMARFFGVPPEYLTEPDGSPTVVATKHDLDALVAMRDERVQVVMGRVLSEMEGKDEANR